MKSRLLLTSIVASWLSLIQPSFTSSQEKTDSVEQNEDSKASFSLRTDLFTKYIFNGINFSDNPVIQPNAYASYKNFTLGAFLNFDTKTKNVDEVDFSFDYSRPFGENANVSLGYNFLTFIYDDYNENVHEVYMGISLSNLLNESLSISKGFGDIKGFYVKTSLEKTFDFDMFSANIGANLVYSNKYFVEGSGFSNLEFKFDTPIRISERLKVIPNFNYSKAINKNELKNEVYYGSGLEFEF